jgi:hypothetical protein
MPHASNPGISDYGDGAALSSHERPVHPAVRVDPDVWDCSLDLSR